MLDGTTAGVVPGVTSITSIGAGLFKQKYALRSDEQGASHTVRSGIEAAVRNMDVIMRLTQVWTDMDTFATSSFVPKHHSLHWVLLKILGKW